MDDCVDLSFSYSDFSECNIPKKNQNLTFCFLYLSCFTEEVNEGLYYPFNCPISIVILVLFMYYYYILQLI